MARVFVGIPTLNRPQWVQDAVNSVCAQTLDDFRLVVSDNASDGDAPDVVADFVRKLADPRVRFHCRAAEYSIAIETLPAGYNLDLDRIALAMVRRFGLAYRRHLAGALRSSRFAVVSSLVRDRVAGA